MVVAGLLSSFEQLAADAKLADLPSQHLALSRLAAEQLPCLDEGVSQITDDRGDLDDLLGRFTDAFVSFDRHTRPGSWLEALLKAHLGAGFAFDAIERLRGRLPAELVRSLEELTRAQRKVSWFSEQQLREAIEADASTASSLALFGRRVIGEATAQAQRVSAHSPELMSLLTGAEPGSVSEISASAVFIADLVEDSAQRMTALGLQP